MKLLHSLLSSRSLRSFAIATIAVVVTVSTAFAQDRGQRRGGPGAGGFGGGFGGRGGPMGGDPTLELLRVDEVRAELEITDAQADALKKLGEKMRPERPEGQDFRSMSEEERNSFFAKMRKEAEEKAAEAKGQLYEVLRPMQMERLEEISLQVRGVQALADSEVADELEITDAQKKELEEVRDSVRESMQSKMRELFSNRGSGEGGDMREQMSKMRTEVEQQILAVLTAEQRAKFEEMKGEEFELPEGAMGRGGFGGPGGDRGGRGGDRGRRGEGRPDRGDSAE